MVGLGREPYLRRHGAPSQLHGLAEAPVLVNGLYLAAVLAAVEDMDITSQLIGEPVAAYGPLCDDGGSVAADKAEDIGTVIGKDIIKFHGLLLNAVKYDLGGRDSLSVEF